MRFGGKMKSVGKRGFSLIEVMVAMFILIVIIASVMMLLSSSYTSLKESEAKNIAKNIATYTLEYIRSRTVTADNKLGHDQIEFGNDETKNFPGLVDLWDEPSTSNPSPLRPNGDANTTINIHPALPNENYADEQNAFYYSLQGYVSIGDFDHLSTANPSPEDANLKICDDSAKHYHSIVTDNRLLVRFPIDSTINNGTQPNPSAIRNFSAGSTYIPYIYTDDTDKTNQSKQSYNPHYTNDSAEKSKTLDYRGFRVLTTIVARKSDSSASNHVQYFDVKVTVLWVTGGKEHEYSLASQIVAY